MPPQPLPPRAWPEGPPPAAWQPAQRSRGPREGGSCGFGWRRGVPGGVLRTPVARCANLPHGFVLSTQEKLRHNWHCMCQLAAAPAPPAESTLRLLRPVLRRAEARPTPARGGPAGCPPLPGEPPPWRPALPPWRPACPAARAAGRRTATARAGGHQQPVMACARAASADKGTLCWSCGQPPAPLSGSPPPGRGPPGRLPPAGRREA